MKNQENNKRVFDLEKVGYTDLENNFMVIKFDKSNFANALFNGAKSIDMDDFARAIHKQGKAEINDQVIAELTEIAPRLWQHRAASALIETISKL